jgi:hypothetical protein
MRSIGSGVVVRAGAGAVVAMVAPVCLVVQPMSGERLVAAL